MAPDPLTAAERSELQRLVAAARSEVDARVADLGALLDDAVAAAALDPADDEHDPDGTTAYERAQLRSLLDAAVGRRAALTAALAALDGPDAGTCATCSRPVGFERLAALPGTAVCTGCATSTGRRR